MFSVGIQLGFRDLLPFFHEKMGFKVRELRSVAELSSAGIRDFYTFL
jgi:hypothetical protein